ncbi:DUF4911 domain-containing protein [Desulfovibrio legallii]|nr:DUF4911 domain-containing protein [Desulfovibrio legallii]CAI3240382.1 hypothetical protein DWUX_2296 [Desulfovibrio diazotrophicus]
MPPTLPPLTPQEAQPATAAMPDAAVPTALAPQRRPRPAGPSAPARSSCLLVRMAPQDTGLFRRLLEAYDNLAYFTVLETDTALLKLVFSPHMAAQAHLALAAIARSVPFTLLPWPLAELPAADVAAKGPAAKRL